MDSTTPSPEYSLTMDQCWALLDTEVVGRVALIVDNHPEIFPVNFVLERRAIAFRTAGGTKLWGAITKAESPIMVQNENLVAAIDVGLAAANVAEDGWRDPDRGARRSCGHGRLHLSRQPDRPGRVRLRSAGRPRPSRSGR
jgi:hypothetical protein